MVVGCVWVNTMTCVLHARLRLEGRDDRRRRDGDGDGGSMCVIFSGLDAPGACGCAIRCARWAMAVRAFFTSWAPPASTLAWPPARTCAVDCRRALDTVRDTHNIVGTVR